MAAGGLSRSERKAAERVRRLREEQQRERLRQVCDDPEELRRKVQELASAVRNSKYLVVYTGAGISTAASIPDYRGPNGVWTLLQKGRSISATDLSEADPTLTHMSIARLHEQKLVQHVVSQNCDGLHLRSGLPRMAISELHGNMHIEVRSLEGMQGSLFVVPPTYGARPSQSALCSPPLPTHAPLPAFLMGHLPSHGDPPSGLHLLHPQPGVCAGVRRDRAHRPAPAPDRPGLPQVWGPAPRHHRAFWGAGHVGAAAELGGGHCSCQQSRHNPVLGFQLKGTRQAAAPEQTEPAGPAPSLPHYPASWPGPATASLPVYMCALSVCLSPQVLKKYPRLWCMTKPPSRRPKLYIVNLQWTPKDDWATLKLHGKCDDVMRLLMDELGLEIPHYSRWQDPIFSLATPLRAGEEGSHSQKPLCRSREEGPSDQGTPPSPAPIRGGWFGRGCTKRTKRKRVT
ncbi:NAD-dependent protein deacetylase sirtuin-7 isoform X2 [Loxodonta africana]|uniref:NAD-dependent protein deacetylase sirtuin-7 isoform X2 n=1 Tax=Loxodonta africana TaxID=9785 RepID=UPI0030CAEDF0